MKAIIQTTLLILALASGTFLHAASTIQFGAASYSVAEDAGTVVLNVQRLGDANTVVSVDYASTNGTATAGLKYTAVSGTLTFEAGQTNLDITVPILNDSEIGSIETFQILLSNPSVGAILGGRKTVTVRIIDNDVGLEMEYGTYRVGEDGQTVTIGVVRGDDGNFPITVDFATVDGTAKAGADYAATSGTFTFAPGRGVQTVKVDILNDGLKEGLETFRLTLANLSAEGALGTRSSATISILDNDPGVGFDQDLYSMSENEPVLKVRVLRGNDMELGPFTVDLSTTNSTATGAVDYVELLTTLAFAEGETEKVVEVRAIADERLESGETFRLVLESPSGPIPLGLSKATVFLFDGTGFTPQGFEGVRTLPGGGIELTLGGSVAKVFRNYFDLYPVETSLNLVDWNLWMILQGANNRSNALAWIDSEAAIAPMRYYRVSGNHFVTPYPKPPGPFPVGVVSRLINDPSRRDRYPRLPGESAFMITVWYPAIPEAGKPLARLEDELVVLKVDFGAKQLRHFFRSYAQADVACANSGAPFPILAYSPGGWGLRTELAERGPFLASHGFVVLASDPIDAPGTTFPDGSHLAGRSDSVSGDSGFQDRVRDVQVALDELALWNQEDPLFKGRLDASNVAVAGWSWGGGVGAEMCRIDSRCRAAVSFEGYYQNAATVLSAGLDKPLLGMYASELYSSTTAMALHSKATRDSVWFQIQSTVHQSFSDYYWNDFPARGIETAAILNTYTLWFLNKYLKGHDAEIPDPKAYPRIFNFKQK